MAIGTITKPKASELVNDVPFLGMISSTTLVSGDDLDNCNTMGIYRTGGTLPAHTPSGAIWAVLVVYIVDTTKFQMLIKQSTFWLRTGNSSGWQGWYKYEGTSVS